MGHCGCPYQRLWRGSGRSHPPDRVREAVAARHLSICAVIKDQALAPRSWRRMRLPLRVGGIDQALMVAGKTLDSIPVLPRWASLAPRSAAPARGSGKARAARQTSGTRLWGARPRPRNGCVDFRWTPFVSVVRLVLAAVRHICRLWSAGALGLSGILVLIKIFSAQGCGRGRAPVIRVTSDVLIQSLCLLIQSPTGG